MKPTPDDLLAMSIVAHLGEQPDVPAHIAARLKVARTAALAARTRQEPIRMGNRLALRGAMAVRSKLMWLAMCAVLAGYGVTIAQQEADPVIGWHNVDDSSNYVEQLQN